MARKPKKPVLWAMPKAFGELNWISFFSEKPRKTKKTPWLHTTKGTEGFLKSEHYTMLTGKKPPKRLTRLA